MKKRIALLGSTGSIGIQALEVIRLHPEHFQLEVLTANQNSKLLIEQALIYKPNVVVIGNDGLYREVFDALDPHDIKVYAGEDAISQITEMDTVDMVLVALVGFAGLKPVIHAIKAGKPIALANKESLVVAGEIVTQLINEKKGSLIPIDSEHSAIFQCLAGESPDSVKKIILTASGGPFRGKSLEYLGTIGKTEALNHPNWNMGDKITIDSASLMNKGLEVIEAKWLFGLKPEEIEVVIHPQSIVHSLVQFKDGSLKAQMGLPDMRLPIQYALAYPERLVANFPEFSFIDCPKLTFEQADIKIFRNLALAFEALEKGGNSPCVLNAANEMTVDAFLNDRIGFLQMPDIIEECIQTVYFIEKPSLDDYFETDRLTREKAVSLLRKFS
ncbi:MAG: 1-deoxy-D-xylulose-5-phosphate reductoisomerase [Chlorobi bacterium]|nr:1-deoxy-D-xylulose-5-phosphate reductoisomerase [Chlorobiota bacterium]